MARKIAMTKPIFPTKTPQPTPQVLAEGLQLDDEGTCSVCGGTGGWQGLAGRVECKPCGATGLDASHERGSAQD